MSASISGNYDVRSQYTGTSNNQAVNIDDFLQLISAQLQNQDMMNPMSDTEFISQLAQFTSLQINQTLAENQSMAMAMDFLGKEVTVANAANTGSLEKATGVVEKVTFYEGTPMVYVNGKQYSLYQVMEIGSTKGSEALPNPEESVTLPA